MGCVRGGEPSGLGFRWRAIKQRFLKTPRASYKYIRKQDGIQGSFTTQWTLKDLFGLVFVFVFLTTPSACRSSPARD